MLTVFPSSLLNILHTALRDCTFVHAQPSSLCISPSGAVCVREMHSSAFIQPWFPLQVEAEVVPANWQVGERWRLSTVMKKHTFIPN